jgi:predicted enzyme related to lactoylglutathione lyase
MPRHAPPTGAPCWFELASTDPDASLAFHRDLFGWQGAAQDMGEMGITMFEDHAIGWVELASRNAGAARACT